MRICVVGLFAVGLLACGSSKPGWMKHQAKLLDDEEQVADGTGTTKAAAGAAATNAAPITAADTTPPHCVGFRADGTGALVIIGDDDGGARFLRAAAAGAGVDEVVMVKIEGADSEEAVFGSAQAESIEAALPQINAQREAAEMRACTRAEAPSGGGFRRTERVVVAYPKNGAARVSLRDGAVWVTPDGKGARSIREIAAEEGHVSRVEAVYYNPELAGFAVVVVTEWGAAMRSDLLWVTGAQLQ